jgi:hypothetical protein
MGVVKLTGLPATTAKCLKAVDVRVGFARNRSSETLDSLNEPEHIIKAAVHQEVLDSRLGETNAFLTASISIAIHTHRLIPFQAK